MISRIQDHLQAIYRTPAPAIEDFLLDGDALHLLMGDELRSADEWVLVSQQPDGLELGVYVDPAQLEQIGAWTNPAEALSSSFAAYCVAIEGVSHFLMLVERAGRDEPVSLLELEVQAEVDKYVCARLLLPSREQEWRARLFGDVELVEGLDSEEEARYLEAGRLAEAFCVRLLDLPHVDAVLAELRSFWRASGEQRMEFLRRLAA
ncbi:MAG: hypothetical protein QGG40_15060 [Myxococcota bacterium]|nr:hypothetical protein [Myxococcota bacterium]